MSTQVILVDKVVMNKIMTHYQSSKVNRNGPGVIFAAKTSDAAITAYKSGKVLFQGHGANREAEQWGQLATPKKPEQKTTKGDVLPQNFAQLSVIGSDETGTGDFFGPVTVAACYIPTHKLELVRELGVKDSKSLTDDVMRKIEPDLKATLKYSVLTLDNVKYNEIQALGNSQGKIKALLHNQALKHVLRKMEGEKPDYILVDQFAERAVYYNYLKEEPIIIRENLLLATKAEGLHLAVAAASIIARVAFLEEMDKLSESIGIQLPKGAGKKVDETAARILLKNGEATLKNLTKYHFANTKKAKVIAQRK